jgi:GNAT superfamily N-acetyltransferase
MVRLVSLRERPDLRGAVFADAIQGVWPEFMRHDPTADLYFDSPHLDACLDTAFAVLDPERPDGPPVGRAFAVPFASGEGAGRTELPDAGWDAVIRWAHADRLLGRAANAVSALEITLLPSHRGRGASHRVLRAMAERVRALGYRHFFAPVRPTAKHLEPFAPMAEYASRTRPDGLPADPWLRVHVRAGGRIEKVAPTSMVIAGTLADWRRWTGMAFDRSGEWVVPRALVPVHVSREQDRGAYVEPNVWVRHTVRLASGARVRQHRPAAI